MPIRALIDGGPAAPVLLDAFREDEKGFFWIYTRDDESVGIAVPFPYGPKPEYECSNAAALILLNPFQVEAAVMEVKCQPGSKRLGYIFPAVAAGSLNHKYSGDKFFQIACYAGVYQALHKIVSTDANILELGGCARDCRLDDVLKGEIVIFVAHIPNALAAGITLDQLSADLHRHGYIHADEISTKSPERLDVVRANFAEAYAQGRLALRALSKELAADSLVKRFVARRISCPEDPVLRFFYLYQIVERILELELRHYSSNLLAEFSASDLQGPRLVSAFHDLKEAFSDKGRLGKLFGERTKHTLQSSPTNGRFEVFLKGCEIDENGTYWERLYKIRNVVFHSWWSIPSSLSKEFAEVVAGIENDVPELLLNYVPPKANQREEDYCI